MVSSFKRSLFAKSAIRLAEICFGAGILSIWLNPSSSVAVKLGIVAAVVLLYITAFVFAPARMPRNGDETDGT